MAVSDLFKQATAWVKKNPGYAIGGAGGAGFVGYLVYKQSQQKKQQSTASGASGTQPSTATSEFAAGDMNATPSYDYLYGYYTGGQSGGSNPPPPTTNPPPSGNPPPSDAVFYTTKQGDTVATIYQAAQSLSPHYWGEDRILLANANLTGYNYSSPLPAGLKVQVAGTVAGYGAGVLGIKTGWQRVMSQHHLWSMPDTWADYVGVN